MRESIQSSRGICSTLLKEIPRELPPPGKIKHKIEIISFSFWLPTYRASGDRFKEEIRDRINSGEISRRVYRAEEDTDAGVMFTQPTRDRPEEHKFLLDWPLQNTVTIRNYTPLPNIGDGIDSLALRPLCSKIDLTDG